MSEPNELSPLKFCYLQNITCDTIVSKRVNYESNMYVDSAYVDVIVLKRSCPAVSHICSFTFSPPTSIVLILKSTPIVVMYVPIQDRYLICILYHVQCTVLENVNKRFVHMIVNCKANKYVAILSELFTYVVKNKAVPVVALIYFSYF